MAGGSDFVNEPQDVLEAFKTYYTTAQLADATDPNLIIALLDQLDGYGYGYGYYDDFEVNRVVAVELDPTAKQAYQAAFESGDTNAAKVAKDCLDALLLFKSDMSTYHRAYTFLSQIFDYGNTKFEKRAIFYRQLTRLLNFGQEREGVDLSQVVLTHHTLKDRGQQQLRAHSAGFAAHPHRPRWSLQRIAQAVGLATVIALSHPGSHGRDKFNGQAARVIEMQVVDTSH